MQTFLSLYKADMLKLFVIYLVRIVYSIFVIFPIDRKKIVFNSYGGLQCSCNPYYIYKKVKETTPKRYRLFWRCNKIKKNTNIFEEIIGDEDNLLITGTFTHLYHMMTAGVIITNSTLPVVLPFRKGQTIINTWHGGGLFKKTYGLDDKKKMSYDNLVNRILNRETSVYTSSCKAWSDVVVRGTFKFSGKILNTGMARNDLLFDDCEKYRSKIKEFYGIPMKDKVVFYAPTFRGAWSDANRTNYEFENLDIESLLDELEKKFHKKFHFIYRGHHAMKNLAIQDCINATDYPDMQELLAAADFFISDYSSCLWDFSLTQRPCFIYAPDFEDYLLRPGFESDYKYWPFPIAHNNRQLMELIDNYNHDDYVVKVQKYHALYESFERGCAADEIVDYINKL